MWYLSRNKKNLTKVSCDSCGDIMAITINYTMNWDWDYPDSDELSDIMVGDLVSAKDAKAILADWAGALSDKLFFADDLG